MLTAAKKYHTRIELVQGDITAQDVDAIVNAANTRLLGGGGVDGAIHRAAGRELLRECRLLNGCETGDAKITKGYNLKARHVIHAVGPRYRMQDAPQLLASVYRRSIEIAIAHHLKSIAFPAISTGIFGYPKNEAAPISLLNTCDALIETSPIQLVRFVLFTSDDLHIFAQALKKLVRERDELQAV